MPAAAPRFDSRLIAALVRLDDRSRPIAETYRRAADVAETIGLSRPSYEQVRKTLHMIRARRVAPGAGEILLDVAFRVRPAEALLNAAVALTEPRTPP